MPELEPTAYDVKGVEVLLTGTHAGIDIDEAYLDAMVSNFDTALHEPKVTYGHVKDDEQTDPVRGRAAGKVARLYREGSRLLADYSQVEPDAAADMTGRGMWNKRSVEIYPNFNGKGPALRNVARRVERLDALGGRRKFIT